MSAFAEKNWDSKNSRRSTVRIHWSIESPEAQLSRAGCSFRELGDDEVIGLLRGLESGRRDPRLKTRGSLAFTRSAQKELALPSRWRLKCAFTVELRRASQALLERFRLFHPVALLYRRHALPSVLQPRFAVLASGTGLKPGPYFAVYVLAEVLSYLLIRKPPRAADHARRRSMRRSSGMAHLSAGLSTVPKHPV